MDNKHCAQMTAYCNVCGEHKPASFRPEKCAETGKEYEDLCCDTCDYIIATVTGRLLSLAVPTRQAEPVGEVVEDECDRGRVRAALDLEARCNLPVGTKLYAAPPAPYSEAVYCVPTDDGTWEHHDNPVPMADQEVLYRDPVAGGEAESDDLHISHMLGQQREKERNREAVKELEALRTALLFYAYGTTLPPGFDAAKVAQAALAKHGTQAATPDHSEDNINMVLTAYGEKAREAAAKVARAAAAEAERIGKLHDEDSDSRSRMFARAREAGYIASGIASMPLPAQSEGEEK
jgi:hypothetical protein